MKIYKKIGIPKAWNPYVNGFLTILFIFIAYSLYCYFQNLKVRKEEEKKLTGKTDVSNTPIVVSVGTTALKLNDLLWTPFGIPYLFDENQRKIVAEIEDVPTSLVPDLEKSYQNIFKESLKKDLIKKLSDVNWNKIKSKF
jgi:hypothetical protein